MYHLHTTEAVVVRSAAVNEGNRLYLLFTKEFGMIWAKAQSVRLEKSKLRSSLQDFSLGKISLVRGKELWRIVGIELQDNLYYKLGESQRFFILAELLRFLVKMLADEGREDKIFEDWQRMVKLFNHLSVTHGENILTISKTLFMWRALFFLGYITPTKYQTLAQKNVWSVGFLNELVLDQVNLKQEIEKAIESSHL